MKTRMKELMVSSLLGLLISIPGYGQFNTGGGYLLGMTNAHLGVQFQESDSELLLGLHTEAGYFIKNRWSVGGSLLGDFSFSLSGLESNVDFLLGPNTRYYLARDEEPQIYIFGFAGYGLQKLPEELYMLHHALGAMVGPGINLFLTERLAIDARATYFLKYLWNPEFGGSHMEHRILFELGFTVLFPTFSFEL